MKLRKLHEAATPGPWQYNKPQRVVYRGQQGPLMSYLAGNRSTNEGMTVSLGSERYADHEIVAYLRNHTPDFIALIDAAEEVLCRATVGIPSQNEAIKALDKALAPLRGEK